MPLPNKTIKDRWPGLDSAAERNTARLLTEAGAAPIVEVMRAAMVDAITIETSAATVDETWHGRLVLFTQGCTITIPTLPVGFSCGWSQESADPITFEAGDGVTIESLQNCVESAGQFGIGGLAAISDGSVARLYGALA